MSRHYVEALLSDEELYDRAKAEEGESFPIEVADRLLAGENPIRVYRNHRRMTQNDPRLRYLHPAVLGPPSIQGVLRTGRRQHPCGLPLPNRDGKANRLGQDAGCYRQGARSGGRGRGRPRDGKANRLDQDLAHVRCTGREVIFAPPFRPYVEVVHYSLGNPGGFRSTNQGLHYPTRRPHDPEGRFSCGWRGGMLT